MFFIGTCFDVTTNFDLNSHAPRLPPRNRASGSFQKTSPPALSSTASTPRKVVVVVLHEGQGQSDRLIYSTTPCGYLPARATPTDHRRRPAVDSTRSTRRRPAAAAPCCQLLVESQVTRNYLRFKQQRPQPGKESRRRRGRGHEVTKCEFARPYVLSICPCSRVPIDIVDAVLYSPTFDEKYAAISTVSLVPRALVEHRLRSRST